MRDFCALLVIGLAGCGEAVPLSVSGSIVDELGVAIDALTVSVCAEECYYGTTDGKGRFTVVPPDPIDVPHYALEVHGRPSRVTYYTRLPTGGTKLVFESPLAAPRLPESGPSLVEDGSAQTVTSGGLTLAIELGTTIQFSVEDFNVPHGHELRVLPVGEALACSPFEAAFSKKVGITIANRSGLPAGSAAVIETMTGLVNDAPPAGRYVASAKAHVAADGKTITTDAGEGILELTWLRARAP